MANVKDLITLAESEVGYLEKKSNAQLDDKTANAGDKNFTKYSRDLVQWIGSPYAQGVAWCDQFVDWVIIKTFGKDKAKELLGGWSAYTPTSAQYYKNMGRWYTSNPQIGDQIFFKNSIRINHTGLVYAVDSSKVYTIEGNTSSTAGVVPNGGCVAKKSYPLNYAKIAGYGRPAYPVEAAASTPKAAESPKTILSYPCRGIDVSGYQTNLDYAKLKASGVQFAILKVIRKDGNIDKMFETHLSGFEKAEIPVICCYNYSYAVNVEKAKIDALTVVKYLNGRKIPVCLDVEDKCQQGLGEKLINIINAYQGIIEQNGLDFVLYTGLSFWNSYIKPYISKLNCKNNWIARYYNGYNEMLFSQLPNETYKPNVPNLIGWQYTSSLVVNGSPGRLDANILYSSIFDQKVTGQKGVVTANSLFVRDKGSTLGKPLGTLKKGDVVTILGTDPASGWYQIADGAYASNKYIDLI